MESSLRVWIGRVLPWAAFVVAVVFAFAQLAARHAAERDRQTAEVPVGPLDTVQPGQPSQATPMPVPLDLALEPLTDHGPEEHRGALLAVARARLAAQNKAWEASKAERAQLAARLVEEQAAHDAAKGAAREPWRSALHDAVSGDPKRVAVARRYAASLSPLEVRRLSLRVRTEPRLAAGALALVSSLPPGRETDRLEQMLSKLER